MKKLILLFCLIPFFAQAQYDYLKLENTQLVFEKVYALDSLKDTDIEKLLSAGVPKLKDVTIVEKSNELIIAKIKNSYIDYRRFREYWRIAPSYLGDQFFGDVAIMWKDGKYKVTVNNMYFYSTTHGMMKSTDIFTRKRGSELKTNTNTIVSGGYIERYLADLFLVKPDKNNW
ncbi:hypothetical protein GJJ64_05670 [Pedobacter sp. HX-22-1]|jgi:hypothetical protein|uniref:DUF4468 domain-containing protein n=2 Tax=Pedobacter puniceum TaxID=2666136 RepID=A0A7K0FNR4_9SPHI|nr:hypothetical protein [Pedobacter puniceum]